MRRIACLLAILLLLFALGLSEEPITCDAGQFAARQTASVTCHFYHSMKDSTHHVFVLHFPFDAPEQFSGNDVLKCSQLGYSKPLCKVEEGYQFNNDISDRLTVTIPEVKEGFAGRYVCQVVPPDGRSINACDLTVNGTINTNTKAVMTTSGTTTETLPRSDCPSAAVQAALFGIITTLLVCIIVTLLIVVIRIRKFDRSRDSTSQDSQTKTPMLSSDSAFTKMAVNADSLSDTSLGTVLYELNRLQSVLKLQTPNVEDVQLESGYNTQNSQSLC